MTTLPRIERECSDRAFPWKCPSCLKMDVYPTHIPYTAEIKRDGMLYSIHLPQLEIPRCQSCGELLFDDRADDQINNAYRTQLRLMTPTQIHQRRTALGLNPDELAEKLGIAEATISRWETGAVIQSQAMDNLLRVYFALPQVRTVLTGKEQDPLLGVTENPKERHGSH